MENLRLFLGIALSKEAERRLSELAERMALRFPYRSWTHPFDYHLTLHFLGETPESDMFGLNEAAALAASESNPPRLALDEPGLFGAPSAPRILWCGIREPDASSSSMSPLAALQSKLGVRLAEFIGYVPEARPYRPHVTIARKALPGAEHGRPAVLNAWRDALLDLGGCGRPLETPEWRPDGLTLYRTFAGRRPAYERIAHYPFGGVDRDTDA